MKDASSDWIDRIDTYLRLSELRDLETARSFWAGDRMHIVVPGGQILYSLDGLVEWAKTQYLWVKKDRTDFDCMISDDKVVVVSRGTLHGESLGGDPFEDVRYVDYFVIRDGGIVEQHIWNDLALHIPVSR